MSIEIFMQRVKEVLLDDDKRKIYDETGEIPGEDGMGDLSGYHPLRTHRETNRQRDSETDRDSLTLHSHACEQRERRGRQTEAGGAELGARRLFEGSLHMCGLV
jgi:hypothetical protein